MAGSSKGEPWALVKMKEKNDMYARLARDEELTLRQAGVTQWHAAADARPGSNAKAETAAQLMMEGDLKTAAEELVKVRRERLRALYAADRASWQGRLAGMGLAMETS